MAASAAYPCENKSTGSPPQHHGDRLIRHEAVLHFSRALVRKSVTAYWRKTVGYRLPLALAITAAWLAARLYRGDRTWLVGALGAALALGLTFLVSVYVAHYRDGMRKLRAMGSPHSRLMAQEAGLTVTSGAGGVTLKWTAIAEIRRFPDFWLVLLPQAGFFTIPTATVPAEMQAFMLRQAAAAGAKVDAITARRAMSA
jgi:YcxB-like protein